MVSLDGVRRGCLVASISGHICIASLEAPSREGLDYIVDFRVYCIFSLTNGNFHHGLCWCWGCIVKNCLKIHHD